MTIAVTKISLCVDRAVQTLITNIWESNYRIRGCNGTSYCILLCMLQDGVSFMVIMVIIHRQYCATYEVRWREGRTAALVTQGWDWHLVFTPGRFHLDGTSGRSCLSGGPTDCCSNEYCRQNSLIFLLLSIFL